MRKLEMVRGKSRRFVEFDTLDELILWLIDNKIATTAKIMWNFPSLKGWWLFEDTYIRRVNQKC